MGEVKRWKTHGVFHSRKERRTLFVSLFTGVTVGDAGISVSEI
jgi:hypothetical protein